MHTTTPTVDSILGPASDRYFGSRYAQVIPTIEHLDSWQSQNGRHTAKGTASIQISGLWSKKGARTAVPHLGTIDVLSLSLQATEAALARLARPVSWTVTLLEVRAPSQPVESGFEALPLALILDTTEDMARSEVVVGGFTVSIGLAPQELPEGGLNGTGSVYRDVFRSRVPELAPIDRVQDVIRTQVSVGVGTPGPTPTALDATKARGLNLIDAFVTVLQLGQVLLYELDGLTRADSETLWMRTTRMAACTTTAPSTTATATLENPRIRTLRQGTWRLATITGALGEHFTVSCAVAHHIP
ncbi:AvrD family protein [Arthrobacter woluwensis]|uniref:AvrD family protein n=1 Tax=Arthrobacter woluwensis TaxID=156980 RepID=UPI0011A8249C|nr:AvrD family protein [Arthrobacter woluwensis]